MTLAEELYRDNRRIVWETAYFLELDSTSLNVYAKIAADIAVQDWEIFMETWEDFMESK